MKAIIAGTSLLRSSLFKNWDESVVETPYGKVSVSRASQYLFLQRHGKKAAPPHMINHRANIWALKEPRRGRRHRGQLRGEPQICPEAGHVHHPRRFLFAMEHTHLFRLRDALHDPPHGRRLRPENVRRLHVAWRWRRCWAASMCRRQGRASRRRQR